MSITVSEPLNKPVQLPDDIVYIVENIQACRDMTEQLERTSSLFEDLTKRHAKLEGRLEYAWIRLQPLSGSATQDNATHWNEPTAFERASEVVSGIRQRRSNLCKRLQEHWLKDTRDKGVDDIIDLEPWFLLLGRAVQEAICQLLDEYWMPASVLKSIINTVVAKRLHQTKRGGRTNPKYLPQDLQNARTIVKAESTIPILVVPLNDQDSACLIERGCKVLADGTIGRGIYQASQSHDSLLSQDDDSILSSPPPSPNVVPLESPKILQKPAIISKQSVQDEEGHGQEYGQEEQGHDALERDRQGCGAQGQESYGYGAHSDGAHGDGAHGDEAYSHGSHGYRAHSHGAHGHGVHGHGARGHEIHGHGAYAHGAQSEEAQCHGSQDRGSKGRNTQKTQSQEAHEQGAPKQRTSARLRARQPQTSPIKVHRPRSGSDWESMHQQGKPGKRSISSCSEYGDEEDITTEHTASDLDLEFDQLPRCSCRGLGAHLRQLIDRLSSLHLHGKRTDNDSLALDLYRAILAEDHGLKVHFEVCWRHLRLALKCGGYCNGSVKREDIRPRMVRFVDACENNRLSSLRDRLPHYPEFRADVRKRRRFEDQLGPNNWFHIKESRHLSDDRANAILDSIDINLRQEMSTNGTVNIDVFSWLIQHSDLWEKLLLQLDMFAWHSRSHTQGWERNCVYSLIQQVMRMDPYYYMLYVCIRKDHLKWLVSVPYCIKNTRPEDKTEFRHMDTHPSILLADGGMSRIQGSVSLTDETSENCTELILGMHHTLSKWWPRVKRRMQESKTGDNVDRAPDHDTPDDEHALNDALGGHAPNDDAPNDDPLNDHSPHEHQLPGRSGHLDLKKWYTAEDKRDFGDFVRCPCPKGFARITYSAIGHGSTPQPDLTKHGAKNGAKYGANKTGEADTPTHPADTSTYQADTSANQPNPYHRRTMLPWFVGVDQHHDTVEGYGTYSAISEAHRTFRPIQHFPSGQPDKTAKGDAHHAILPLSVAAALPRALVGQIQFDQGCIGFEMDVLFGEDRDAAQRYIDDVHQQMVQSLRHQLAMMEAVEMRAYLESSFFKHRQNEQTLGRKIPKPAPHDPEEEDQLDEVLDVRQNEKAR